MPIITGALISEKKLLLVVSNFPSEMGTSVILSCKFCF